VNIKATVYTEVTCFLHLFIPFAVELLQMKIWCIILCIFGRTVLYIMHNKPMLFHTPKVGTKIFQYQYGSMKCPIQ